MASAASPSTVTVSTVSDSTSVVDCSLREAIRYADGAAEPGCTGGTSVMPAAGATTTITLPSNAAHYALNPANGTFDITGKVIINGGGESTTIIDGGQGASSTCPCSTIFTIEPSANVQLNELTVTGGKSNIVNAGAGSMAANASSGGGISDSGTLTNGPGMGGAHDRERARGRSRARHRNHGGRCRRACAPARVG